MRLLTRPQNPASALAVGRRGASEDRAALTAQRAHVFLPLNGGLHLVAGTLCVLTNMEDAKELGLGSGHCLTTCCKSLSSPAFIEDGSVASSFNQS